MVGSKESGRVDLQSCVPVGANLIVGDITEPFTQQAVLDAIDTEVIDVVVSDISPYNWQMGYRSSGFFDAIADVFDFALPILKYGGHFVTKLFQGAGVRS